MKRQATISSYFATKKPKATEKIITEPDLVTQPEKTASKENKSISNDDRKRLHEQFVERLGAMEQAKQKRHLPPLPQNYSPLELQVVELKSRYPDYLLLIEVGYKFRFFGDDAKVKEKKKSLLLTPPPFFFFFGNDYRLLRKYYMLRTLWIATFM